MNILRGLNFPDDSFDVVYSAQFIEHLTYPEAVKVMTEVRRILKPGGVLRLVTPDLEELTHEYLNHLTTLKEEAASDVIKKYEWIRLEIFDQIVRDSSGGEMVDFIEDCDDKTRKYVAERIGYTFTTIADHDAALSKQASIPKLLSRIKKLLKFLVRKLSSVMRSRVNKIGRFRQCGEVHRYLHDFFSLSRVLRSAGFSKIVRTSPTESAIPDWNSYELDRVKGQIDGPHCLYVEATK
jgi:SAM-dependent methyltransferase